MRATDHITGAVRAAVAQRAGYICEYCLIDERDTYFGCEVDHIISVKHGGTGEMANLAYACAPCNRHKGADVGSVSALTGEFVRFYNPRADEWSEHFAFSTDTATIVGRRPIGEATARILQFNSVDRIIERTLFLEAGRFPSAAARDTMGV